MAKNTKQTSPRIATLAAETLQNSRSSKVLGGETYWAILEAVTPIAPK
ncbi:MAG: hypothetical protein JZU52_20115 [Lamprocystis purpurea]|jgi:hypothetical protein|nr:hypothetical protein [Lamprocystis purpurea]MBV5275841.1 hypothetical protein [Lamprocystis purpurea]